MGFLNFIEEFLEFNRTDKKVIFAATAVIVGFNAATELILKSPEPVGTANGNVTFVYDMHWPVVILFAFVAVVFRMLQVSFLYFRRNDYVTRQLNRS
jgi:hypothetical protein